MSISEDEEFIASGEGEGEEQSGDEQAAPRSRRGEAKKSKSRSAGSTRVAVRKALLVASFVKKKVISAITALHISRVTVTGSITVVRHEHL